jgi:hypothetical protein
MCFLALGQRNGSFGSVGDGVGTRMISVSLELFCNCTVPSDPSRSLKLRNRILDKQGKLQ